MDMKRNRTQQAISEEYYQRLKELFPEYDVNLVILIGLDDREKREIHTTDFCKGSIIMVHGLVQGFVSGLNDLAANHFRHSLQERDNLINGG
jgi:hypothetical protein